ncbi:MAG: lipid A biosynthesis acyltransferase [Deltaproteobacteria bacterium]|nr:lipid A biosynthesis acyltransferase [Deltaproteobacteria bacterium]
MARAAWLNVREQGSVLGMRVLLFLCTSFGRPPARLLLRLIALYYALAAREARRASCRYLQAVGMVPSFKNVYTHVLRFAEVSLDRLFFLRGNFAPFVVNATGQEHILRLRQNNRGAILLGAHLGSFEAMRAAGKDLQARINIVGYFGNARAVNRLLDQGSGGNVGTRLLEITPDSIDFIFKAKDLLEKGEMLAILGDRVVSNHVTEVMFFGRKARFPTGPFVLAASLKCPVYLTFGLYFPPNRYELHCEPFAESVQVPRGRRAEALQAYVQAYALRLEHYCRQAPYNWFNFFPFWSDDNADDRADT